MKTAIFGSGGLGAYYGVRLSQAGHAVSFIARGAHLKEMTTRGLTLHSPAGDAHLTDIIATDEPASLGEQDLVIVAVKSWQLHDAAQAIKPLVGRHTIVLPFLNGVEASEGLARVLGEQHVLGGLSRIFSKIETPGVIRHFNDSAYVEFGELNGERSDRCLSLDDVFTHAGIESVISDNIQLNLWRKLILVSSWGGLSALNGCSMGELRKHPETRELITSCAREACSVANAEGHDLPDTLISTHWQFYDSLPAEADTSLSRDVRANRPSELEALHGVVVRLAEHHRIDVPNHRFIYQALLPRDRAAR